MNKPGIWNKTGKPCTKKKNPMGAHLPPKLGPDTKLLPWISNNPNPTVESLKLAWPSPGTMCGSSPPRWKSQVQCRSDIPSTKRGKKNAVQIHATSVPPIPHPRKALPNLLPEVGRPSRYLQLANLTFASPCRLSNMFSKRHQNTKTHRTMRLSVWYCFGDSALRRGHQQTSARWYLCTQLSGDSDKDTRSKEITWDKVRRYTVTIARYCKNFINLQLKHIKGHGGQAAVPMFWTCSVTKSMKACTLTCTDRSDLTTYI